MAGAYYTSTMKTISIRVPDMLASDLEAEASERSISMSDVARERLQQKVRADDRVAAFAAIADLAGSVDGGDLPRDLGSRKKYYLQAWGYGRKRAR
jgi:hypothetical protein